MGDKKATYIISEFDKNDYMVWHVCSQCLNNGTVVLKDNNKTYFTATKNDPSTNVQHLTQGGDFYSGNPNLRLEVTVFNSNYELDASINSNSITDRLGNVVGHLYSCCIEDQTDRDYNDFYINIAAWRKKG